MLKRVILGDGEFMFLDDLQDVAETLGLDGFVFAEKEFTDGQHLLAGFTADEAEDLVNLHNLAIENCGMIEGTTWTAVNTEYSMGWTLTTVVVGHYELNWVGLQ